MDRTGRLRLDGHRLKTPERTFGGFSDVPTPHKLNIDPLVVHAKAKFLTHLADTYAIQGIGPLGPMNTEALNVI
jgi:hypothetical protein